MTLKRPPAVEPRHALPPSAAPRRRPMSLGRKVLLTVMTVGTVATTIGAGTFASFTASTQNPGNTFSSGTLILGDKVNTATMCFSSGSAVTTNTADCGIAFNAVKQKPGTSYTVDFDMQNAGSVASALSVLRGTCTPGDVSGAPAHGSDNPCDAVRVRLQEYDNSSRTATGAYYCWFGASADLGNLKICSDGTLANSQPNTINQFASSALTLQNPTPTIYASTTGSQTRYFRLTLSLLGGASSNIQGRSATFNLTWQLQ